MIFDESEISNNFRAILQKLRRCSDVFMTRNTELHDRNTGLFRSNFILAIDLGPNFFSQET